MIKKISLSSKSRTEIIDITPKVENAVKESKVMDGLAHIYIPHTTAGIMINENADPSVKADILDSLGKLVPFDDGYAHIEGNAAAHIKSALIGTSATVFIEGGALKFGTWQGIFFCEFDGPRQRSVLIYISKE